MNDVLLGTFRDGLRSPVHRWFPYPVGFSPAIVSEVVSSAGLEAGSTLYDPFAGTGTTLIEARRLGMPALGLEAHPFVHFVGSTKLNCYLSEEQLQEFTRFADSCKKEPRNQLQCELNELPSLLHRCYSETQLIELLWIRQEIYRNLGDCDKSLLALARLALAAIARPAARVSTGWPNISPTRVRSVPEIPARELFFKQVALMVADIRTVGDCTYGPWAPAELCCADARLPASHPADGSVDLVLTSAPYLNNFDYADRTRLETYLLGDYSTWRELTDGVRRRLVYSSTPQFDFLRVSSDELLEPVLNWNGALGTRLKLLCKDIADSRESQHGKKKFELVAAGYFGDMVEVLRHLRRVVRPAGRVVMILGDSALYGVHVATDLILAQIGIACGFSHFDIVPLRTRGTKWPSVRRAAHIALRESMVTLYD